MNDPRPSPMQLLAVWLLVVFFNLAVFLGFIYLVARVVMFAVSQ